MASISHQSPLVWIPTKETEDVDIASAVRSLISSSYGEDPKNYTMALISLARARTEATSHPGSQSTERDLLFKWFHILEMLEVRFPELRVPFTWKDAFTGKPIVQFSLAYEKASIIFNIAATLNAIAAAESRLGSSSAEVTSPKSVNASASLPSSSPLAATTMGLPPATTVDADGTKRAYTALRQAAGFFNYINQNFLHAPSTDMSRELLRFIVSLLLTQANEVFLEKTFGGKSSPGLIAKLAHGVAKGYSDLAERGKEWNSQEVVDRTWTMLMNAKAKHYLSVAQHFKAQADIAASNHGHALVRFTMAESLSKEAVKFANQFSAHFTSSGPSASASTTFGYTNPNTSAFTMPPDAGAAIIGITSSHLAIVSQRRTEAVKDNDLIYHDILPSESTLPTIDETSPAQMITIQEVYSSPEVQRVVGPDLFAKLVPLGVHERASMYSEEKAKLARGEAERSDAAEGERVAALDAMGLPASLEKYRAAIRAGGQGGAGVETLADPGPEVMAWSEEEIKGGPARGADGISAGSAGVNEALSRISNLRKSAQDDLQSAGELLDEESRLCEKARVRLGHRFSQDPSGGHARVKDLRSEIKSNREALNQAQANDGRIEAKWREIQGDVELLARGRGALEQTFAEALASSGNGSNDNSQGGGSSLLDLSETEEQASAESLDELKSKVEALDSALSKLGKVRKERDSLVAELREKLQSDDIGHLLILSHRGGSKSSSGGSESNGSNGDNPVQAAQEAALFRQELEKFRPWQNRLGQAYAAQAHLLSEIQSLWNDIQASPEGKKISKLWDSKSRARTQVVNRLRAARDANTEVRAALAKGVNFYEEAGEISRGLKSSAKQWNEQRGRERDTMERQAEWDSKLGEDASRSDGGGGGTSGLEQSMGNLGLHQQAIPQRQSSYGFSPSPSPAQGPQPPRSYASPPPIPAANNPGAAPSHGLPPPPPRPYSSFSTSSTIGSPAPQTPQYSQPGPAQSSPYDFGSISGGPFGDSSSGRGGAPPSVPPPPPSQYSSQNQSYQQPQSHSSGSAPYNYGSSSGLPPPPPQPQYGHSGASMPPQSPSPYAPPQPQQPVRSPSYGAPPTPSYTSLPSPPAAPPQQGHTFSRPGYLPPSSQSSYPYNPAPPTPQPQQPRYETYAPPPPSQQQSYTGLPPPPPAPSSSQFYSNPATSSAYSGQYQQPPPLPPQHQQQSAQQPYYGAQNQGQNQQWRGY
ncbi:unnamed protein product [Sympodiomycopsis kandeliae]